MLWYEYDLKPWSHSALRLNHNTSKTGLTWSRRCCPCWSRVLDELQSSSRRGRTQGKMSDAAKSFELHKILSRGQPRVAHVVKTCSIRETHMMMRVPAVIKTLWDAGGRERFSGLSRTEHGHRTGVTRWYHGKSRVFSCLSLTSRIFPWLDVVSRAYAVLQQWNSRRRPYPVQTTAKPKLTKKLPLSTTSTSFSQLFVRDWDVECCVTMALEFAGVIIMKVVVCQNYGSSNTETQFILKVWRESSLRNCNSSKDWMMLFLLQLN